MVEDALRRITPKLLRCIFSLQRRTLMRRSAALASCTSQAMALLKTTLKRCGGGSLLPPKDILKHCTALLNVTTKVEAFLKTRPKLFAGIGARKQRVTMALRPLCGMQQRLRADFTPTPDLLHPQ